MQHFQLHLLLNSYNYGKAYLEWEEKLQEQEFYTCQSSTPQVGDQKTTSEIIIPEDGL